MNYIIREMLEEEYGLLEDFLYEAIFVPKGILPHRSQSSDSLNCKYI